MQSGLWTRGGPVPLINVSVHGRIVDFCSEVTVSQKYAHNEANPVEATFKFPLDFFGALCGFEVVLDGKQIVAQVKKREETRDSTPDLLDDIQNQPDTFLCNIGSLEPGKQVELKLTYVTELALEGHALRFILPSSTISPNYVSKDDKRKVKEAEIKSTLPPHALAVDLDIVMPSEIEKIESPTHSIEIKEKDGSHAIIHVHKDQTTYEGNFILLCGIKDPHTPRSTVERDEISNTLAAKLSFFPKFQLKDISGCEIVFLVDCSSSLADSDIQHIQSTLQLFLRSLPTKSYFNIVLFGETFQKLFEKSEPYNDETLEKATEYVKGLQDIDLGGTDIYKAFADICSSPVAKDLSTRQIFVITDGQVPNTNQVISLVRRFSQNTRVFTFGIGERVSHYLVSGMARAGGGVSEFLTGGDQLEAKVMRQLKRALQPALTNLTLDWKGFQNVIQAPQKLKTVFNGDSLLIYAFLDPNTKSGQVTLKGNIPDPVSFSVEIDAENAKSGRLIPVLAARARIRDLEETGALNVREEVIRLGTQFHLASSYTSFVAVEKKAESETRLNLHSSMEMPVRSLNEIKEFKPSGFIPKSEGILTSNTPPASPSLRASGKKVYNAEFLLRFQTLCTELPADLPPLLDIIMGGSGSSKTDIKQANNVLPKSPKSRNNRSGRETKNKKSGSRGGTGGKGHTRNSSKDQIPIVPLVATEGRWERPGKKEVSEYDEVIKKAKGILNKITLEKFHTLYEQLIQVGITNRKILDGVIRLVFDKAISEPHFSAMYAVLCAQLAQHCPSFPSEDGTQQISFKRILLNKCQEEFEGKPPVPESVTDPIEREEMEIKAKQKALGNVRFIGELYKEGMLPEKIMHECIRTLLKDLDSPSEDDMESLCKLITTVGKSLDSPQAKLKPRMEDYFDQIKALIQNQKLASRIRFMLQDIMDLRENEWIPRMKPNEAKTLAAARAEALNPVEEKPAPASPAKIKRSASRDQLRDSRENLRVSGEKGRAPQTSHAMHRSVSDNNISGEWETAGSKRGGSGRGQQKGGSNQGWEVQGGGRFSKQGGRRGGANVQERYAPKVKQEEPKSKEPVRKGPINLYSALSNEETLTPKSALRRSASRDSPGFVRKEVTIQTPKEEIKQEGAVLSEEALETQTALLLEEYLASGDADEALACIEELKAPEYHAEVVLKGVLLAIEKKERQLEDMIKLFSFLYSREIFSTDDLEKGFKKALDVVDDIDLDIPYASKFLSTFIGSAIGFKDCLSLSFLEGSLDHLIETEKAAQIAAGVLSTLARNKGDDIATDMWESSKLNFASFLPSDQQTPEKVNEFLEEKGLSFLVLGSKDGDNELNQEEIILKQTADGFWRLNEDLANILGYSQENLLESIPESVKDHPEQWATVLALGFLEKNFENTSDQWELIAKKARSWLASKITKESTLKELEEIAQQFLQKAE